jgi:hypothetical protein
VPTAYRGDDGGGFRSILPSGTRGIVAGRGTVDGKPVIFTRLR